MNCTHFLDTNRVLLVTTNMGAPIRNKSLAGYVPLSTAWQSTRNVGADVPDFRRVIPIFAC